MNPRGRWEAGVTYYKLDLVAYNGDSYVANEETKDRPSRASTKWTLNAARGNAGGGSFVNPTAGDYTAAMITNVPSGTISATNVQDAINELDTKDVLSIADGTAAAPSLNFSSETTTGLFRASANVLGVSVAGTSRATFTATGMTVTGTITPSGSVHGANGTAANPSLSFASDQDTGLYRIGANNIGVAVNGAKVLDVGTGGLVVDSIAANAATNLTLAGGTAGSSAVKVTNTTAATSTTTGSLQTAGGLGVAGAGWFGGKIVVGSASSLNTANIYSYGTLKVGGAANQATGTIILGDDQSDQANIGIYRGTTAMALGTGNWLNLAGYDGVNITSGAAQFGSQTKAMALTSSAVSIPLTTAATNTTSGALQVAGGVGVQGAGYFGGNGAFGPAFTPNAWGTGGQLDVNGTTGGILGVAYNGTAKGYVLAETGGILVNSHAGGTAKFNTTGSGATTIGNSGGITLAGVAITTASASATAGLRVPHGAAPTSPVNGDIWTTTAGLFVRINGVTVGPLT